jgi:hypothetical protein
MRKSILLLCALTLLIMSSSAIIVYANPSNEGSLGSGYYVTTNWHGIDVPSGAAVIATAKTTNRDVDKVTFTWINPAGQTVWTETVAVQFDGTYYNGKKVYSATSTYTPEALGDWTVKALFIDQNGHFHCCCTSEVARRATSFNVVPEIPLIGTAGASIAMFAGLAVKMKRKPQH